MGPTADFHIASAIILLVVLTYVILDRNSRRGNPFRSFIVLYLVTFLEVCCGILREVLMFHYGMHEAKAVLEAASFVLQCFASLSLLVYVTIACRGRIEPKSWRAAVALMPAACAVVAIVAVVAMGDTTALEGDPAQGLGSIRMAILLCVAFYPAVCLVNAIAYRRALGPTEKVAIWIASIALLACLAIELATASFRPSSFGLTIAVLAVFVTAVNPFEFVDSRTHAYDVEAFGARLTELVRQNSRYSIVIVFVRNLTAIGSLLGSGAADEMERLCVREAMRAARTRFVYRTRLSAFALVAYSRRDRQRIVRQLEEYFSKPRLIGSSWVGIDISAAYANSLERFRTAEDVVQYVDFLTERMRASVEVPDDQRQLIDGFHRSREIRRFLASAIDAGLVETYVQPIYDFSAERFTSVEALSRLTHPELGSIPPDEFIAVAEQEGLIGRLTRDQLDALCGFAARNDGKLRKAGIDFIGVNLSAVELVEAGYGERLVSIVERQGAPLGLFKFEVTETTATRYGANLERTVNAILDAGCGLCMDDFGSGYANLDAVLSLPFDVVKIDRALLHRASESERGAKMYRSVVNMLATLGFVTVAEGVENADQDRFVRELGIDRAQGFFYAKPVPLNQVFDAVEVGRMRPRGEGVDGGQG